MLNKSLLTNLIAGLVLLCSYVLPEPWHTPIQQMGIFALSGALTNWIAIHMLFEKIPFLYGSGIIETRFSSFKSEIKRLIMEELLTQSTVDTVLSDTQSQLTAKLPSMVEDLNYEMIFDKMIEAIEKSPLGGLLQMVGGTEALTPMKPQLIPVLQTVFHDLVTGDAFQDKIKQFTQSGESSGSHLISQVENIVDHRLAELSPRMVKDIIQKMIRQHLGWLVIWGGVFGSLIGLVNALLIG